MTSDVDVRKYRLAAYRLIGLQCSHSYSSHKYVSTHRLQSACDLQRRRRNFDSQSQTRCSVEFPISPKTICNCVIMTQGSVGRGTCGNTVPNFPLLKCLRTHYGRHCEPFLVKNALIAGFCVGLYGPTISKIFQG